MTVVTVTRCDSRGKSFELSHSHGCKMSFSLGERKLLLVIYCSIAAVGNLDMNSLVIISNYEFDF